MESKRSKPKATKFPETVLAFYIRLYCKQKGTSETKYQSILVEATKTWLSLTEEQKQQVRESFMEEKRKYKIQCFDQLKNAEPFMKVKEPIGSKNVDLNDGNSVIQEPEVLNRGETLQTETEHVNQIVNDEEMNFSNDGELETDFEPERNQEEPYETERKPVQHSIEETPRTFLVEPLPPTLNNHDRFAVYFRRVPLYISEDQHQIFTKFKWDHLESILFQIKNFENWFTNGGENRTSKDLFFMLNPAGGAESVPWTTLTTFEKNQYRRAVCLLKTDYITKYREYLESLTPRELFDYYNKTLF